MSPAACFVMVGSIEYVIRIYVGMLSRGVLSTRSHSAFCIAKTGDGTGIDCDLVSELVEIYIGSLVEIEVVISCVSVSNAYLDLHHKKMSATMKQLLDTNLPGVACFVPLFGAIVVVESTGIFAAIVGMCVDWTVSVCGDTCFGGIARRCNDGASCNISSSASSS